MDRKKVLALLDQERREPPYDACKAEVLATVTRMHAAEGAHHTILYSALTTDTADRAIAEQIEHHRQLNIDFEWKLYSHDQPPDLLQRLIDHGFEIGPREAVMIYDLKRSDAWINQTGPPVIRVDRPEQVEIFQKTAEAIFPKSYAFTAGELANDINEGWNQHRGYIAFDGDEPVSIGRLYLHERSRFGMLFGGATRPQWRGKGFYRAVVAARARDARERGAEYLMADAMPTSRPILQRMGFERVTDTLPCMHVP